MTVEMRFSLPALLAGRLSSPAAAAHTDSIREKHRKIDNACTYVGWCRATGSCKRGGDPLQKPVHNCTSKRSTKGKYFTVYIVSNLTSNVRLRTVRTATGRARLADPVRGLMRYVSIHIYFFSCADQTAGQQRRAGLASFNRKTKHFCAENQPVQGKPGNETNRLPPPVRRRRIFVTARAFFVVVVIAAFGSIHSSIPATQNDADATTKTTARKKKKNPPFFRTLILLLHR